MYKWITLIFLIIIAVFLISQWEFVKELQGENVQYFTDEFFPEAGYGMLAVTLPLMIAQNVFTLFPIIIIIIVHVLAFGFMEGFLFSFAGTTAGAAFCFLLARSWSEEKVSRFWNRKKDRWEKFARMVESDGAAAVIFLRSLPFMPSNLISVAAAVTPMKTSVYMLGTALGNISMIWLLSLIASPLWAESGEFMSSLLLYLLFLGLLVLYYTALKIYKRKAG